MWYAIIGNDRKGFAAGAARGAAGAPGAPGALRDAGRLRLGRAFPAIDSEDPARPASAAA
jgi:hypothetical protein